MKSFIYAQMPFLFNFFSKNFIKRRGTKMEIKLFGSKAIAVKTAIDENRLRYKWYSIEGRDVLELLVQ